MFKQAMKLTLLPAALAVLVACGGGGGGGGTAQSDFTLTGVAATGAAFVGATVTVKDSTGEVVGTSESVTDNGEFSVTLKSTTKAPYVLTASRTSANGEVQSLVSVAASAVDSVVNVTPITHLIASRLSPSGDPSKLASEMAAKTATVSVDTVKSAVSEITTILTPLLIATETKNLNLLSEKFAVDGKGLDRLLDSINVSIVPSGNKTSNISISVKQNLTDDQDPPAINFVSDESNLPKLPTISASALVKEGTAVKINKFLAQLTACYAVPFSDRVNGVTSDATLAVVGTWTDVKSPVCRNIFSGGDPVNFVSNGSRVGRDENNIGAFSGLFRKGATNAVFSDGSFEFSTPAGDLVIGYKSRASNGDENHDVLVVREENNELKLIGNGYKFPGRVAAFQQRRNFISLNQSNYDYYNTGYAPSVPNLTDKDGNPVFNRVVVTSPRQNTFVYRPNGGISFLTLAIGDDPQSASLKGKLLPTNVIRLRSEYLVDTPSKSHPREVDTGLFFVNTDWTEEALEKASYIGAWKFEYYLLSKPGEIAATQFFRTRARALSIKEIKARGFAKLTPEFEKQVSDDVEKNPASKDIGRIVLESGDTVEFETSAKGDAWVVGKDQLQPSIISVFGGKSENHGSRFNDETSVRASDRKGKINCTKQNNNDVHCIKDGPSYAGGWVIDSLQLFARDIKGSEFGSLYGMYPLNIKQPN